MKQKLPFLLLPLAATLNSCADKEAPRPNYVFILADDLGYGDISYLDDNSKIRTPNLDKMASESAVFTDAHSSSSVSTPTRYGILTGRYNWRSTLKNHVLDGYSKPLIKPDRSTIATMLGKQGYTTAGIGKWHLGWNWANMENGVDNIDYSKPVKDSPITRGFDYYYGVCGSLDMPPYVYIENDMPTAVPERIDQRTRVESQYGWWRKGPVAPDFVHEEVLPNIISRGCDYILEKSKGENPYFLYLPLTAPHTPILPSEEFRGKSGIGDYGDFVLMVDAMVGKVIDAVERSGEAKNTVIVFTTDNGCSPAAGIADMIEKGHYPNSIYRGHKADLYDGGHRVPCFVRWRGTVEPHHVDQTVCLTDFYATFASLAGYVLEDCEGEDSYDLSSVLLSTKEGEPIREATIHHSQAGDFTIRKGDWKLLLSASSGGWSYPRPGTDDAVIATLPPIQLYNMKTDPSETNNVYLDYPAIVAELRALVVKYIKDGRSTPGARQSNDGPYPWKFLLKWMSEEEIARK